MKIAQSTWVRYHHFDLARELQRMGHFNEIFTCLPWWKADKESRENSIPRDKIRCNFLVEGLRRVAMKTPVYTKAMDGEMAVLNTKSFSRWVAKNIGECDAYIGISGSGLHAGRVVKQRGGLYIMDRGSTHIRSADRVIREEHRRWDVPWSPVHPWLIENEEAEADEANLITVPSNFVRDTFIGEGVSAAKLRVVPYGVSLEEFHPTGTPDADTFRLVFVGQFSLRKGIPYLLEAFRDFKHPSKELIVVGNVGDEVKPLLAKLGTAGVKFVGLVPRSKVKEYMSTAHALVLPSIEEGLALVQGQAMACGCPVIATANTGSENLFEDGKHGLIVPARDSAALVAAFEKLAADPRLRKQMSNAGLEKVKFLNGWQGYAEKMVFTASEAIQIAHLTGNS